MDPIAFQLNSPFGLLEIRWYGIAMALSMLTGAWIASKLLRRIGRDGEAVWDGLFLIILSGVVGARLVYVLTNLGAYADNPWRVFYVWEGGLSFHGGIILGALASWWYFSKRGMSLLEVFDAFAPGVAAGIILVRIGNFMNGDILGYRWEGPWALNFPHDEYHYGEPAGTVILRHPTEIYGLLVGVACLLLTLWIWRMVYVHRRLPRGTGFVGFIFLYSLIRSVIEEPFRAVPLLLKIVDPATAGFGLLTTTQVASILLIILAIWGYFQLPPWGAQPGSEPAPAEGQTRQQRRAAKR